MAPIHLLAEGAKSQTPEEVKQQALLSPPPLAVGLLSGPTTDLACALLDKLAAVPEGLLPEKLAAQVREAWCAYIFCVCVCMCVCISNGNCS